MPPPTARLEFCCWQAGDLERASRLWCDPDVMRFMGGPYSAEEVNERLAREIANEETLGFQYWPLTLRATAEFIGCCGLKPQPEDPGHTELGFHLLPDYWGKGLGVEAARAVVEHAFGVLALDELYAGHHPRNDASRALLERLGFTQIGAHLFPRTGLEHPWWRRER